METSQDQDAIDALLVQARSVTEGLQELSPTDRNDPIRLARALASEVVELLEEARSSRPPPPPQGGSDSAPKT